MIFGDISTKIENCRKNALMDKILNDKNAVVINKAIENNYEGYFANRRIPERIAYGIKRETLKKLDDNDVLVKINFNDDPLSVKVPSDDHFYFKTAVKLSKQGKFCPIMITEDPNWFKVSTKMKRKYNVYILHSIDYVND